MSVFEESLGPRTRFDLNFRVGDIPVRIHPFFWLSTLLLGLPNGRDTTAEQIYLYLPIWVALVLVSILVHELGHVLMGRYFGRRGHILLTGFCGLAIGDWELPERWQRNLVSLAGPVAGFLFAALATGLFWLRYPALTLPLLGSLIHVRVPIDHDAVVEFPASWLWFTIYTLLWINIFWGLVNLLPVWPLDGGQVSREICQHYRGRDGMRVSLMISLGTAAGVAVLALIELVRGEPLVPYLPLGGGWFALIFFGLLAFQSSQILQAIRRAGPDWDQEEQPRQPWERDPDWWKKGGG